MSDRAEQALLERAARPGWETLMMGEYVHRYPLRDMEPHRPTRMCGCGPRCVPGGNAQLESGLWAPVKATFIHRAFDGRDLVEACEAGTLVAGGGV